MSTRMRSWISQFLLVSLQFLQNRVHEHDFEEMCKYTRSVQKVSDLFLSRQQGMSELPMQSVAAHTRIHA